MSHELIAACILGAPALLGAAHLHRRTSVVAFLLTPALVAVCTWIVATENLAPRFFVWTVPGIAVLVAFLATRHPRTTLGLVLVASAASIVSFAPAYTDSPNVYRQVAKLIDLSAAGNALFCATNLSVPPMLAYTGCSRPSPIRGESISASSWPLQNRRSTADVDRANEVFQHRRTLSARDPAVVFVVPGDLLGVRGR